MKANLSEEEKGTIRPKLHPVHVSNVSLIDPETGYTYKNIKLKNVYKISVLFCPPHLL